MWGEDEWTQYSGEGLNREEEMGRKVGKRKNGTHIKEKDGGTGEPVKKLKKWSDAEEIADNTERGDDEGKLERKGKTRKREDAREERDQKSSERGNHKGEKGKRRRRPRREWRPKRNLDRRGKRRTKARGASGAGYLNREEEHTGRRTGKE